MIKKHTGIFIKHYQKTTTYSAMIGNIFKYCNFRSQVSDFMGAPGEVFVLATPRLFQIIAHLKQI